MFEDTNQETPVCFWIPPIDRNINISTKHRNIDLTVLRTQTPALLYLYIHSSISTNKPFILMYNLQNYWWYKLWSWVVDLYESHRASMRNHMKHLRKKTALMVKHIVTKQRISLFEDIQVSTFVPVALVEETPASASNKRQVKCRGPDQIEIAANLRCCSTACKSWQWSVPAAQPKRTPDSPRDTCTVLRSSGMTNYHLVINKLFLFHLKQVLYYLVLLWAPSYLILSSCLLQLHTVYQ